MNTILIIKNIHARVLEHNDLCEFMLDHVEDNIM